MGVRIKELPLSAEKILQALHGELPASTDWITTCCNSSEGQMALDKELIPEALWIVPLPRGEGAGRALYHKP